MPSDNQARPVSPGGFFLLAASGLAPPAAFAILRKGGQTMRIFGLILALATTALSGCAPLIVGAGGAVIADEIVEDERGGDGLF